MPAGKVDKYTNILNKSITMSAANTLTFDEIDVGLTIFDKVGLLIQRWELFTGGFWGSMGGDADVVNVAITQSNQISTLNADERAVVDKIRIETNDNAAAGTHWVMIDPIIKDYSNLSGGGILVAPRPLYLAMDAASIATAESCNIRLYFTIVQLKPDEYFELLESRRFFG